MWTTRDIMSNDDFDHRRTALALPANALLLKKYLQDIPVVAQGQNVNIIAEQDGIRLTVKGVAEMDGYPNTVIQLKNVDTGRPLTAKVNGDGQLFLVAEN